MDGLKSSETYSDTETKYTDDIINYLIVASINPLQYIIQFEITGLTSSRTLYRFLYSFYPAIKQFNWALNFSFMICWNNEQYTVYSI